MKEEVNKRMGEGGDRYFKIEVGDKEGVVSVG